jgi:CheY-like chemotaxis protein
MQPSEPNNPRPEPSPEFVAKATSELNNLLQIISGSSSALEKTTNTQDAAEYMQMLKSSVDRAELLGRELGSRAGGTAEKAICNSEASSFFRNKKGNESPASRHAIMVVDDEKMALTLIERLLGQAGYDVVVAQSGFEAIDAFRKEPHRYAMVLLDFSLPFMDGSEVFRRLREIRNNIPVVLCTGFILQERLREMMGSGLNGFLRKPVPPDELLSIVRSTLQTAMYSRDASQTDDVPLAG